MGGRRRWVRAALLCAVVAAGCGEEDRTPTRYTPSNDRKARSSDDLTPPLMPAAPGAVPDTAKPHPPLGPLQLALVPATDSSVAAQARLLSSGMAASLSLQLQRGRVGTTYEGSVHQGACEGIGPHVASLVPVTADSAGRGSSSSSLPLALDSLVKSPHVVILGRGGRPEACGSVPSRPAPPPAVARDTVV